MYIHRDTQVDFIQITFTTQLRDTAIVTNVYHISDHTDISDSVTKLAYQ